MEKNLIVQKYGGSSVGDLACMRRVAQHVKDSWDQGRKRLVVVISAMGDYTDHLLAQAHELHPRPPKRELDMLVTTGERVSMALLSIALDRLGVRAVSLTGSQSGILTDETHGNARIQAIMGDRIKAGLDDKRVVIVAGFQGVSPKSKEITSLGRGGSDLTAIALAIALQAQACEIYTDVEGVYTCDPRVYGQAQVLPTIAWPVMCEMAWAGAGVLHHRGAFLASKYQLPLRIRSSMVLSHAGSFIGGMGMMEGGKVTAVTIKKNQSLLQISLKGHSASSLAALLAHLWQHEESPLIFQSCTLADQTQALTLLVSTASLAAIGDALDEQLHSKKQRSQLACVSLIGQGFRQSPEIAAQALNAVKVPLHYFESKDMSMALVVDEEHVEEVVKALHQAFLE